MLKQEKECVFCWRCEKEVDWDRLDLLKLFSKPNAYAAIL